MTTRMVGPPRSDAAITGAASGKSAGWSELGARSVSAVVLMAAALACVASGGIPFDLFWLAASAGILWEWLRLIGGSRRAVLFGLGCAALGASALFAGFGSAGSAIGILIVTALVLGTASDLGTRVLSGLGLIYAGALIVSVVVLRHSAPFGREAIVFLFAVVWGTDCMAYFGGRLVGGPRLAPRLSPSKTWSGFLIGIASGSLLGWAVSPAFACALCTLVLGLVIGAVAQGGDILESMIKRRFKVKDAGSLIPGHGGLMDRLDGFLAASVFAACVGIWRTGINSAGAGLFQ